MRKIKISIGFIFLLLLSGCEANYTLTIAEQTLKEDVYLNTSVTSFLEKTSTQAGIDEIADKMFTLEKGFSNFTKNFVYTASDAGYRYQTNFSIEKKDWPTIVSSCYDDIEIENDGNYLSITTSNRFLCYQKYPDLKDVHVTINSRYKIVDSNADQVTEDSLTWDIKKSEQNDKILYAKVELKKPIASENGKGNMVVPSIVIGILIIGTIIFFLTKKAKQNNSF